LIQLPLSLLPFKINCVSGKHLSDYQDHFA
jgi:hypothetical protein